MANEDAVQDEPQLDESGEPIPTQEQMDAQQATQDQDRLKEQSKTAQTLQLVNAMNQTVAPLPMPLQTQAAPVAPPPPMMRPGGVLRPGFSSTMGSGPSAMTGSVPDLDMTGWSLRRPPYGVSPAAQPGVSAGVAPVEPPTLPIGATPPMLNRGGQESSGSPLVAAPPAPQGRMYMGPAMSPDQESAFMQSPAGTRQNLMPGWTPEKWDAATRVTPSHAPPPEMLANMKRYDAQKSIQEAIKQGMPTSDAIQLYGNGLFPRLEASPKTMTEYQQNETRLRQQELEQKSKSEADRMSKVKAPGIPAGLSIMHRALIQDWVKEVDPVQKAAKKAALDAFVKENPGLIGGTAAASAPAAKRKVGSFKVGDVLDGYRFTGGNERDKKNWEKI